MASVSRLESAGGEVLGAMPEGRCPLAHTLARGVPHAVRLRRLAVVFGLSEPITRPALDNASLR